MHLRLHESRGQKLATQKESELGLLVNKGSQREVTQAGLNLAW